MPFRGRKAEEAVPDCQYRGKGMGRNAMNMSNNPESMGTLPGSLPGNSIFFLTDGV